VSAPANHQAGRRPNPKLAHHGGDIEQAALVEFRGVKLQVADDMNCFRPATEFAEPGSIRFALNALRR